MFQRSVLSHFHFMLAVDGFEKEGCITSDVVDLALMIETIE